MPLIALHTISDLLIWLAYVSIPVALIYFTPRRDLPFSRLFILFTVFMLACGTTHFLDALMFEYPVYRLAGIIKLITAVVSWASVIVLIPAVSQVMTVPTGVALPGADTTIHRPLQHTRRVGVLGYLVGVVAGTVAVLVRGALDPILRDDHIFVIALLAVVVVSWSFGFGPGVVCLVVGFAGYVYYFIPPRHTIFVEGFGNQLAVSLFVFCGVACATLGESQRSSQRRARQALAMAATRQQDLEAEVDRRRVVEAALRGREQDLVAAQRETARALARLNAFLDNAPLGIAFLGPDLRYERINPHFAEANGCSVEDHVGRLLTEVQPDFPPEVLAAYRRTASPDGESFTTQVRESNPSHPNGERIWQVVAFPVRSARGHNLGAGVVAQDITDKLRADEELRRSEEQFHQLAETIPHLGWMMDAGGSIFWYNLRWYDYTGTTLDEMKERGWASVLDPKEVRRVMVNLKAHITAGEPWEDTFKIRGQDGRYRWHLSRARPIKNAAGQVVRWFGTNTDVQGQRELEQALRVAAGRFQTLTEAMPQFVWTCGPDGTCDYLSQQWAEFTGVPTGEQLGADWLAHVHPHDRAEVAARWAQTVADGTEHDSEFRIRRWDGKYRWFKSRAVPFRATDGSVLMWVGTNTDIEDQKQRAEILEETVRARTAALTAEVEVRKQAEADLRRQREFLDAILATVNDGIVTCDATGALTLFNRAAREFHGLNAEPIDSEQWAERYSLYRSDKVTPMTRDEIPLFRALRGERVCDAEMVIAPHGCPTRVLLASGQPLADLDGRALGAVVSMRDVTEQREADRQLRETAADLRRTNIELERSNGELEKFAYVASHDLQEPLRKIQAFGDRLRDRCRNELPEFGREYVNRMLTSAGRMRRLIDDLLMFSRVTTQQRQFRPIELRKLVEEVVSDLDIRIAEVGGRAQVGPLPAIEADPTQMRQLFQNLIANAVKFHRPGEPVVVEIEGELTVGATANPSDEFGSMCRITLRDNGIGFDNKYRERIFEVFQRLHGRDAYEGTGVGLAICRKIVERHGGTITAHGQEGVGATFVVELPVRQPDVREEAGSDGELNKTDHDSGRR